MDLSHFTLPDCCPDPPLLAAHGFTRPACTSSAQHKRFSCRQVPKDELGLQLAGAGRSPTILLIHLRSVDHE